MNVKLVGQSSGLRKQEPFLHVLLSRLVRDELQVKGEELARVEIGSKLNEGNTSVTRKGSATSWLPTVSRS